MRYRDVVISVKGLLGTGEDGDDIDLVTSGKYAYSTEKTELFYWESELTGMDGTKTTFEISPEAVMLTREGTVAMQMIYEEGRKNYFAYGTPYGSATMGLETLEIQNSLGESGGHLRIKYILSFMESAAMRAAVNIHVRPVKEETGK